VKIIKDFFYGENKFQPVYFWITLFLIMVLISFILKLTIVVYNFINNNPVDFSDTFTLGVLALVQVWAGIYNWNNKNKQEKKENIEK